MIEPDSRVTGDAGVFYPDRAASGVVFGLLYPPRDEPLAGVQLDDGEKAWVPVASLRES